MNMNLIDAISNVGKIDALMYAIERSFFDIEVNPADMKKADRAMNVFYATWEIIDSLSANLEQLEKDERAAKANCPSKRGEGDDSEE